MKSPNNSRVWTVSRQKGLGNSGFHALRGKAKCWRWGLGLESSFHLSVLSGEKQASFGWAYWHCIILCHFSSASSTVLYKQDVPSWSLASSFPKVFCRVSGINLIVINVHFSLLTGPLPTIWCGGWFIPEFQTLAGVFSIGGSNSHG